MGLKFSRPERLVELGEADLSDTMRNALREPVANAESASLKLAGYYRIEPLSTADGASAALLGRGGTLICTVAAAHDNAQQRVNFYAFSVLANGQVLSTEEERGPLPSPEYVQSSVAQGCSPKDLVGIQIGKLPQAPNCLVFSNADVFRYLLESRQRLFDFWVTNGYLVPTQNT